MINVNEIINELEKISEALNNVETKGLSNHRYLLYAQDRCENLKTLFTEVLKKLQNEGTEQEQHSVDPEQPEQEGEANGEQDTGVSG